jgi:hypothetical protein
MIKKCTSKFEKAKGDKGESKIQETTVDNIPCPFTDPDTTDYSLMTETNSLKMQLQRT